MNKEKKSLNSLLVDLEDDFSRGCLLSYFAARVSDNAKYMFPYYKKEITYYSNDIFELSYDELLLDVGACIGNAIWLFTESVQGKYKGIVAIEPEEDNFMKLQTNIKEHSLERVILRIQCIYNQNGYVDFKGEKEYGGIARGKKRLSNVTRRLQ